MSQLEDYYKEHADQARQHEGQRERMTSIVLAVAGILVGLVTFSKLSFWSLPAAFTIVILGAYGFCFAGKHYERFRYHSSIMARIRCEMDRLSLQPNAPPTPLSKLRSDGEKDHYVSFKWPSFRGTRSGAQADAKSWIARQRLHVFWEAVHLLVVVLGLVLSAVVIAKAIHGSSEEPLKIRIVGSVDSLHRAEAVATALGTTMFKKESHYGKHNGKHN